VSGLGSAIPLNLAAQRVTSALAWQAARTLADEAELDSSTRLSVEITHDGGPTWLLSALRAGVAAEPRFEEARSQHKMRAELVELGSSLGLRFKLARRGWELAPTEVWVVALAPWLIPVCVGLAFLLARGRWWAWSLAAGVSQAWLWHQLGTATWTAATGQLPLRLGLHALAHALATLWPVQSSSLDSIALAAAATILATLGWDQARRGGEGRAIFPVGRVILTLSAGMALIEGSASSGLFAVASEALGAATIVALIGLALYALAQSWLLPTAGHSHGQGASPSAR
jgi:hypothetical protein